jgi:hypothetical protein
MLKPLIFAPCERVIIGMGDQSASLIVILHGLQMHAGAIPPESMLLSRFSVFTQWYKSPDEEGKTFEQRVAMVYENESPVLENIVAFKMTESTTHRVITNFQKFPALTKYGEYTLTLSIRAQGESAWPIPVATYPLAITLVPKATTQVQ